MDSGVFVSNLKSPRRFDFICVDAEMKEIGKFVGMYRLCGIEDIVEIREGELFVSKQKLIPV